MRRPGLALRRKTPSRQRAATPLTRSLEARRFVRALLTSLVRWDAIFCPDGAGPPVLRSAAVGLWDAAKGSQGEMPFTDVEATPSLSPRSGPGPLGTDPAAAPGGRGSAIRGAVRRGP